MIHLEIKKQALVLVNLKATINSIYNFCLRNVRAWIYLKRDE